MEFAYIYVCFLPWGSILKCIPYNLRKENKVILYLTFYLRCNKDRLLSVSFLSNLFMLFWNLNRRTLSPIVGMDFCFLNLTSKTWEIVFYFFSSRLQTTDGLLCLSGKPRAGLLIEFHEVSSSSLSKGSPGHSGTDETRRLKTCPGHYITIYICRYDLSFLNEFLLSASLFSLQTLICPGSVFLIIDSCQFPVYRDVDFCSLEKRMDRYLLVNKQVWE